MKKETINDGIDLFTRNGSRVKPLYKIGTDVIQVRRLSDGAIKKYSVFDLMTKEALEQMRSVQSSLPDIIKRDRLKRVELKKKYDKKLIKKLAIKLYFIVQRKIDQLKNVEPTDLYAAIPKVYNFSEFKKSHLKHIVRAMHTLEKYGLHHQELLNDANNELELRRKSSKEREKEREKIEEFKKKWRVRAAEVMVDIKNAKHDALPIVKRFAAEIYDVAYKTHSNHDCDKLAIKLLEEVEENAQAKKEKRNDKAN